MHEKQVNKKHVNKKHVNKKYENVLGKKMAYVEVGSGEPIVFLHGNPTSSYLWRNVIPHLSDMARCIAPDLIGMGDSEKADDPTEYRFVGHRRYLDTFLAQVGVETDVVFVVHDWGSALGFDWAYRHPGAVKGLAYMESIVRPLQWREWPESARSIFEAMRSGAGEELVMGKNVFVERILPASVLGDLAQEEHDEYRRPFIQEKHRIPTLTWPREIPIDGQPDDVHEIVSTYSEWLRTSEISKLFINAEPGSILTGDQREFCRTWPNQIEVTVAGSHFVQEDSPEAIGEAIARWYQTL
ncbi:MAG: haloalkane dehalogenase [Acidimicrobiia bacterium]|nr:haloalkane dehalogenase [Acidimicrobiia bacterium]